MAGESVSKPANPFVGPRPFRRDESDRFFARRREVRILCSTVLSKRAVLLFSQSGAGKTSLIQAGLIPSLESQQKEHRPKGRRHNARVPQPLLRVLPVATVGGIRASDLDENDNPFVMGLLSSLSPEDKVSTFGGLSLVDGLAPHLLPPPHESDEEEDSQEAADAPRLLVIDQFEQLFTQHPERAAQRADFFRQLSAAMETWPQLRLLIAMREDYIAELTPLAGLLPHALRERFRLERLRPEDALEAVCRPADEAGIPFAEGVAESLVEQLRVVCRKGHELTPSTGERLLAPDVEPVHIQIVCRRLWSRLPEERKQIQIEDVKTLGDVDQALTGFYEDVLKEVLSDAELKALGLQERKLRAWFGEPLITPARTRGLVYCGEEETSGLPNPAVERLASRYLLHEEPRGDQVFYELSHDRLVGPILQSNARWMKDNLRPLTLAAEAWDKAERDPHKLFEGRQLKEARSELDTRPDLFFKLEESFVKAGEEARKEQERHQRAKTRRTRLIGLVLFVFMLVFAGLAGIAAYFWQETVSQRDNANRSRAQAEKLVEFMIVDLHGQLRPLGRLDILEQSAQAVQEYYQSVEDSGEAMDADALHRRGVSHINVGDVLRDQGDLNSALIAYCASMEIAQRLAEQDPENTEWQQNLSESHIKMGGVLRAQGKLQDSLASYRASLEIMQRLTEQTPENDGWQRELSVSHYRMGDVLRAQGNLPDALSAYRDSMEIRTRLVEKNPDNTEWQRDLSIIHDRVGNVRANQGNLPGALAAFRASVEIRTRLAGQDPQNAGWQRDLSVSLENVGDVRAAQDDLPGALAAFRASMEIRTRLAEQDPDNAGWQRDLSVSHEKEGDVLRDQGDLPGAVAAYRASMEIAQRLADQDRENAGWQADLAYSRKNVALIRARQPDGRDEAVRLLEGGLEILRGLRDERRLTAEQESWIREMEEQLAQLREANP